MMAMSVLIFGLLYSLFNRLLECLLTLAGIPSRSQAGSWRSPFESEFQYLRRYRLSSPCSASP